MLLSMLLKKTIFYIFFSIDFLMILILTLQRWNDRFPIQNNKPFHGFFPRFDEDHLAKVCQQRRK